MIHYLSSQRMFPRLNSACFSAVWELLKDSCQKPGKRRYREVVLAQKKRVHVAA